MKNQLIKHILIRLSISIVLLLLLHFSQIEYSINANLTAMGFENNPSLIIGTIILFVWIIYLVVDIIKHFKRKLKWFAVFNIVLIIALLLGYGFINILVAVTRC